tara:strand:- start:392 stop:541 length:150 start_codon:yes stop_codon:yes gene_type:complete
MISLDLQMIPKKSSANLGSRLTQSDLQMISVDLQMIFAQVIRQKLKAQP